MLYNITIWWIFYKEQVVVFYKLSNMHSKAIQMQVWLFKYFDGNWEGIVPMLMY